MTNKFLSKGTTLQSEPGPLANVDYVSPDEGIGSVRISLRIYFLSDYK
jgi:hypothetical protein